jgi:hypothetical protein
MLPAFSGFHRSAIKRSRMATSQEKYQCKVATDLDEIIRTVTNNEDLNRGAALRLLIDLALKNSEVKSATFNGNETANCTMQTEKGFFATTVRYRNAHRLDNKKARFFRHALTKGASVYRSAPQKAP